MDHAPSIPVAPTTIDEYISAFATPTQVQLQAIRDVIRRAAPLAKEKISYRMPTFTLHGNLVHFAAFKRHIGLYPGSAAIEEFSESLSHYKTAKGSIQFPIDQEIPSELIRSIVLFCVESTDEKMQRKGKKASSNTVSAK